VTVYRDGDYDLDADSIVPVIAAALTRVQQEARAEAFEEAARMVCAACRFRLEARRHEGIWRHYNAAERMWEPCEAWKIHESLARARSSAAEPNDGAFGFGKDSDV
jgi:hypothetical protein